MKFPRNQPYILIEFKEESQPTVQSSAPNLRTILVFKRVAESEGREVEMYRRVK